MGNLVRTFPLQWQEQKAGYSRLRSDEIEKMEATVPSQVILSRTSPIKRRRGQ